jgi:hypothetical protein
MMSLFIDARVPVTIGEASEARQDTAWLIEGRGASPGCFELAARPTAHPVGCTCCAPRGPVSDALNRLFLARARGEIPFFTRVIAVPASPTGEAAIRAALAEDPLASARFRLA